MYWCNASPMKAVKNAAHSIDVGISNKLKLLNQKTMEESLCGIKKGSIS